MSFFTNSEIKNVTAPEQEEYAAATDFFQNLQLPKTINTGIHDRTIFVSFDGTGNDRAAELPSDISTAIDAPYSDANGHTNPDLLAAQLTRNFAAPALADSYASYYTKGIGTNESWAWAGVATGNGIVKHALTAMNYVSSTLHDWREIDPDCKVSIVVCGFSRGSATARYFLNLVNEYGVPAKGDEGQELSTQADDGTISRRWWAYNTSTAQQAPGAVHTSALLYDTVATGQSSDRNDNFYFPQTIPPTTDVAVHITSADERRVMFPEESILNRDGVADKRLLEITLPGVHSDIGGGYADGVGVRKLNLYYGQLVLNKLGLAITPSPVVSSDASLWKKHDSSTVLTYIARLVAGQKRGLISLQNPDAGVQSQHISELYGALPPFAPPSAIASKYAVDSPKPDNTSAKIYHLYGQGAVESVTGFSTTTTEILKAGVRDELSAEGALSPKQSLSQQKLVSEIAGGPIDDLVADPSLYGEAYAELTDLAQAVIAANTTFGSIWGGIPFVDSGDGSGNVTLTSVPGDYDVVFQTVSSLFPFDKGSAFNTMAVLGKTAKILGFSADSAYAAFKLKLDGLSPDLRDTLDYFDGTNADLPVAIGSSLEDVVAPSAGFQNGRLYGFKDGGDIVSNGGNTLIGEVGFTKFVAAGGDTVEAVSQKGSVWFRDTLLLGGQWNADAGGWVDAKGQYVYRAAVDASGQPVGDLTVSAFDSSNPGSRSSDPTSALTIKNWVPNGAGNLGIRLDTSAGGGTPFQTFSLHMDSQTTQYFNSSIHYWDRSVAWYVDPNVQLMTPATSRYNITLDNVLPGDVTVEAQPATYSSQFSYGYYTDDQLSGTNLILHNNKLGTTVVLRDGADLQNTLLNKLTFADGTVWSLSDLFDKAGLGSAAILNKNPIQGSQTITESSAAIISRAGVSCDYHLGALSSNKTIKSFNANLESRDSIIFGSDVLASDLTYSQSGDDLLVTNTKQGSVLRVAGFLGADIDPSLAKGFTFASGAVLSFDAVQALASAYGYTDTSPASVSDLWKTVVTSEDASGTGYTLDISAAEDAVLAAIGANTAAGMALATDFFKSLQVWDKKGMVDVRVFREHIIAAAPTEAYAFDVATQPPPISDYYALQNTQYQMPSAGGSLITGGGGNSVAYGGGGADTFNLQNTSALQIIHAGAGSSLVRGQGGLNEIIDGGAGDDVLYTSYTGKAFVNSGKGNDLIISTSSYGSALTADTTYFFARGFGTDTIFGDARTAPSTILFDQGIEFSDVAFTKVGSDLVINVADEPGSIQVRGYFVPGNGSSQAPVNIVAFADGSQLGFDDILAAAVVVDPRESVLAVTRKLGLTDDATNTLIDAYGDVTYPGYGPAKQLESFVAGLTSALGLAPAKAAAFNLMQSLNALDAASSSYSVSSALDFTSDETGIAARSSADLRHALIAESPFVVAALGSAPAPYPGVVNEALDMPAQYWADRADILRLKLAQAGGTGPGLALGEQRHDTSGNPLKISYSLLDYTATSFVAAGATPNGVSDTAQFLLSTYLGSSLVGGAGVNHLYGGGTGYSLYLDGTSGTNNLFVAGPMYTTMVGGQGFNSFYARAHTFITNGDRQGLVTLSSAIDASKVGFAKSGNDLKVHVSTNTADDIVIKEWFGSGHSAGVMSGGIQAQNADGTLGQVWSQDVINASFVRTYETGQGPVTWNVAGQVGTVIFGGEITSSSFAAVRRGNDLTLNFANPNDSIVLQGWFTSPDLRPQQFKFSDGTELSAADLSKYADVPQFGAGDGVVKQTTPYGATAVSGSVLLRCAVAAVVLRQVNYYDLEVCVKGTADVLTIKNYFSGNFAGSDWKAPTLKFLDGVSFAPGAVPVEVDVWRNSWVDANGHTQFALPYETNPITIMSHNENVELADHGGDTTFVAGTGTETFNANGGHNSTFRFGATSGTTTVNVYRYDEVSHNIVEFDATVVPSAVLTRRDANGNLVLTLASGKDLTFNGFFESSYRQVDQIQFADGTIWTAATLAEKAPLKLDIGSGNQTSYVSDAGIFVELGAGISPSDLVASTDASGGVKLSLAQRSDSLDLPGWYPYGSSTDLPRVLRFADGTVWDDATLQAHVINLPSTDGSPSFLRATSSHPIVQGFAGDNEFWGGAVDATLIGGSGSNWFFAGSGNVRLQGGPGLNTIYGASSSLSTYVFGTNPNETDTVYIKNFTEGKQDTVLLASGITASDVTLAAVSSYPGATVLDLVIGLKDRSATFTVAGQFFVGAQESYLLDKIEFADGTAWSQADIRKHFQPSANADGVRIGSPAVALVGSDVGDTLQAGDGAVTVLSGASSSILLGGTGDDTLVGADLPSIVLGGTGNNAVQGVGILGTGHGNGQLSAYGNSDVVLFNQGDGHAQVQGWSSNSVISLGGGIDANDVTLTKNGQDLIISTGAADDITLSGWYWGGNAFGTLQVFEDASSAPLSSIGTDAVHSAKVAEFNLAAMGHALADFSAAGSSTTSLHLSEHLTQFLTSTSDTQAFGGDVAHFYAAHGALQGMDLGAARGVLADPTLGSLQQLHSLESLRSTHNQFQILGST